MPHWFSYRPVLPLLPEYADADDRVLTTGTINTQTIGTFEVSLIGDERTIELVRIKMIDCAAEPSAKHNEYLEVLFAHMLSVLRLTYDRDVSYFRHGGAVLTLSTYGDQPTLGCRLGDDLLPDARSGADNVRNVFINSMMIRPHIQLLADTQNGSIPLHYRYLSLYKVFEMEFRERRVWRGLEAIMDAAQPEFEALNLSPRRLVTVFHDLRDKCAHIKTGGADRIGIFGIETPDARLVTAIIPILTRHLLSHLGRRHPDLHFAAAGAPVI